MRDSRRDSGKAFESTELERDRNCNTVPEIRADESDRQQGCRDRHSLSGDDLRRSIVWRPATEARGPVRHSQGKEGYEPSKGTQEERHGKRGCDASPCGEEISVSHGIGQACRNNTA